MENIDFTQWPVWLVALLLILNLFKAPLSNLFPAIFGFLNAKAAAQAEVAEIVAEGARQDEVAEKLMLANLVKQLLAENGELIGFLTTRIVARLDTIDERLIDIATEHRQMRQEYERVVQSGE